MSAAYLFRATKSAHRHRHVLKEVWLIKVQVCDILCACMYTVHGVRPYDP